MEGVAVFDFEKKSLVADGKDTFSEDSLTNQWPNQIKLVSETKDAWYFVSPVFAQGDEPSIAELPFIDEVQEREHLGYVRVRVSKASLHALEQRIFNINILI